MAPQEPLRDSHGVADSDMNRRGPFRPSAWVSARRREALRLRIFIYRGIDIALSVALTLYWLADHTSMAALATVPIGVVLPYAVALFGALAFVRSLDLYGFNRTRGILSHAALMTGGMIAGAIPGIGLQWIFEPTALPHLAQWLLLLAFLMGGLHLVWATAVQSGRHSGALIPNIVVVGATEQAQQLIQHALEHRDMNVIAVFDDRRARAPESVLGVPVLGSVDQLIQSHVVPYIDTIAVAISPSASDRIRDITRRLSILPNQVLVVFRDRGAALPSGAMARLARTPVARLSGSINADRSAFFKRLQDLVFGTLALAVLAPLLIVIGLLVRLDSPGPALFRQQRHGFNQEIITVWKFRTMRHETADATASRQVTVDDDRVTRIGRFLRATSIDELPQLINVILGEMSLVGPRPHAIGMKTGAVQSASIVAEYAHRHRIKPGLTGWAAIHGSRGPLHTAAEVRRRVQLDIEYIDRQSFWLDMWIMLRTVPVLLGDKIAAR